VLEAIRYYLKVISEPTLTEAQRLTALVGALDRLAWAYHDLPDCAPTDDDCEPPKRQDISEGLRQAFPSLGSYATSDPLAGVEQPILVADGIDDIADIAADLADAAWRWEHVGEANAIWHLKLLHGHWGRHLLDLRSYLHAKLHGW
jgi:hypothetical protein